MKNLKCVLFIISMVSFTSFSQEEIVCNENNYKQYIHVVGVKCDLRWANLHRGESPKGESPRGGSPRGESPIGRISERANLQEADLRGANLL